MKYTRRLQLTGGSTYILSLPSKWIQRTGLTKGSELEITESGEGLRIETASEGPQIIEKTLTFPAGLQEEFLERILTSIYISYFDVLNIQTEDIMESALREAIKRFARRVMGVEIFEETSNSVILQNVLNSGTFTTSSALRRMALNVDNMIADTISSIKTMDYRMMENIMQRDDEVDRYQWYIFRETRSLQTSGENSVYGLLFSRILERIADHTVNICKIFLDSGSRSPEPYPELASFLETCYAMYQEATAAFYSGNLQSMNPIIEKKSEVYDLKGKLLASVKDDFRNHVLITVSEEVTRVGLYATDIAELGMDNVLGNQSNVVIR